jgi:hypothetical protein
MASIFRSFTEISVLLVSLTAYSAQAGVLGSEGPLLPDATGNWKEFRTGDVDALVPSTAEDVSCVKRLPENLRQLFFAHFRYYVDHSKAKVGETEIARFAKVLGMTPHESGGASAAVTDMKFKGSNETLHHFYSTDNPGRSAPQALYSTTTSLDALLALKTVKWNSQTNFGLLQMSADRLYSGGGAGEIAVSTLTNLKTLYLSHPEEVIARCGAELMYKDAAEDLRQKFDEMQACEPGYTTKSEVQCFGRWATLCPNFNVTLALIAPPAYFATRSVPPLCAKTFRQILRTGRADGHKPVVVAPKKVPVAAPSTVTPPVSKPLAPKVALPPSLPGIGDVADIVPTDFNFAAF